MVDDIGSVICLVLEKGLKCPDGVKGGIYMLSKHWADFIGEMNSFSPRSFFYNLWLHTKLARSSKRNSNSLGS